MKYLTRIIVDKKEVASLELFDNYCWHKALWKAFPGHNDDERSFLFRIDDKQTCFQVYLLSELPVTPPAWGHWVTKKISSAYIDYKKYLFQLRVNPTKRIGKDVDKGKRVGIYKEEDLKVWLTRKAEQAGFIIANFAVSKPITEYFRKNGSKQNKVSRVDFDGILEVVDKEKFKKAFNDGLGSAKSLGYGMLILKPIE
jgi:CRISPR system Cascade subunit CasE